MGAIVGLCLVGCPPSGPQLKTAQPTDSGEETELFSIAGMTNAIEEIDAKRGSQAIQPLQAEYEKEFKTEPKNPFKRFLWAYSRDDRNDGWQELVKVTKLNSKFYWAYVGMGSILDEWKVYDQADGNFQRALELGPGIAIGYHRYGRMQMHKANPAKAVELLQDAVEKAPGQTAYRLDLARALAMTGDKNAAKAAFEQVIVAQPDSFAAHEELGKLLESMGDKEAAVSAYAKAAELSANAYSVRVDRARLTAELDRLDDAVAVYQEACALQPDTLACWQALAALGAQLDRQELRVQSAEQIIRIDPENLLAHKFLAPIYLAEGAIEKALPSYQLVLAKEEDNLDALFGLAQIYEQGEEFSKAVEFFQRVLLKQPDHGPAKAAMQRLFKRFHILAEPLSGRSPEQVFADNRKQIASVYKLRLAKRPGMQGDLLLKVTVGNDGAVGDVQVARNTVGDLVLELCAVWNLKRSRFPAGFGATYDFELTLKPGAP
jgi:tetratricopeptide (TPR) repeat protein